MDLIITNNRTCAAMSDHNLCLDYQLPAIQKIFTQFLKKHPQIPEYKGCWFSEVPDGPDGPELGITCLRDSSHVRADQRKYRNRDPELSILLSHDETKDFETLECSKNGCYALNARINYSFRHYPDGECSESVGDNKINKRLVNMVPCDGEVSLFDEYLKHSTIALPKPVPPPNAQNAQTGGTPPSSGNSPPQNPTSFSYLQTGLGAASTMYCVYKTYKEMMKIDEEGQRDEGASRLKRAEGHAGSGDSKNQASGWRALGYLATAIASGAFTLYTIRA